MALQASRLLRSAWRRRLLGMRGSGLATHRSSLATVALGISGGVDSAVAALLLKQEGHEVIGVHMSNWDHDEEVDGDSGCGERERRDAQRVCDRLNIGFHEVSFVREYWQSVFEPFVAGVAEGATPNPDVWCNRHIKFGAFSSYVLNMGADWLATGHYAKVRHMEEAPSQLLAATDNAKDQSYFLAQIHQEALKRTLFPLGDFHKPVVRQLATEVGLHVASKRDSTGICFVGKRKFSSFIKNYLPEAARRRGAVLCVESGRWLGDHEGQGLYTHGQRIRIGGLADRWYVADKIRESNTILVCEGREHPALRASELSTERFNWIAGEAPPPLHEDGQLQCAARVTHRGQLAAAEVEMGAAEVEGSLRIRIEPPMQIALSQTVALYKGEVCLGGALIGSRGSSLYEEQMKMCEQA